MNGLRSLAERFPGSVLRLRGAGTFISFDASSPTERDALITGLRQRGVEIGGCGTAAIRLRPTLVFTPRHAAQFLDILEQVISFFFLFVSSIIRITISSYVLAYYRFTM